MYAAVCCVLWVILVWQWIARVGQPDCCKHVQHDCKQHDPWQHDRVYTAAIKPSILAMSKVPASTQKQNGQPEVS